MSTVAVIDYGMGNLHSVAKALEHVADGQQVIVTHDPERIRAADRVVLPGVGAIRDCMAEMARQGVVEVIHEVVRTKPFLGVCVGMQALMDFSAENGGTPCLGILPGRVEYFGDNLMQQGERLKVPHMGWNQVHQERQHPLWRDIAQDERFYFVHSYYVQPAEAALTAASAEYGVKFTAAVTRDNVFAVQFHPEKSQHAGLALYANFLRWDGQGV
ncbi:imidazole glycerol phosphate synthase subunit HisH [Sulfurivermis fontis]|uniref:imidazole glycerol phosphate synthase subunit HisH n=1 Tax=Sulfurivermis fontis TaxID=1972068 RepID=UPI000FD7405B|nr:imidazole glycerol phosphate synthase subunit HisH [Sulfurivermis fontis]